MVLNTCRFFFIWTTCSLKSKFVLILKSQQVLPVTLHLPHANVWARLECKLKSVSSLKQKKFSSRVNDLKIISILQNEMLLLMLFCERVLKQSEDILKYVKTMNNSVLGTVCYYVQITYVKIAYLKIF